MSEKKYFVWVAVVFMIALTLFSLNVNALSGMLNITSTSPYYLVDTMIQNGTYVNTQYGLSQFTYTINHPAQAFPITYFLLNITNVSEYAWVNFTRVHFSYSTYKDVLLSDNANSTDEEWRFCINNSAVYDEMTWNKDVFRDSCFAGHNYTHLSSANDSARFGINITEVVSEGWNNNMSNHYLIFWVHAWNLAGETLNGFGFDSQSSSDNEKRPYFELYYDYLLTTTTSTSTSTTVTTSTTSTTSSTISTTTIVTANLTEMLVPDKVYLNDVLSAVVRLTNSETGTGLDGQDCSVTAYDNESLKLVKWWDTQCKANEPFVDDLGNWATYTGCPITDTNGYYYFTGKLLEEDGFSTGGYYILRLNCNRKSIEETFYVDVPKPTDVNKWFTFIRRYYGLVLLAIAIVLTGLLAIYLMLRGFRR